MSDLIGYTQKIRDVCGIYFLPPKLKVDGQPNPQFVLHGDALRAIECLVSLSCLFRGIQTCQQPYVLQFTSDILWGLEHNHFWVANKHIILPLVQSSFNSFMTSNFLAHDAHKTPEKEAIAERERKAWHQIFPAALGCVYGHPKMLENSHAMLVELNKVL